MNKTCTNSSCRKTFSTLTYGGQCPFCGKLYPQLKSARKDHTPAPDVFSQNPSVAAAPVIRFVINRYGRKRSSLRVSLRDVQPFIKKGEWIKAIKAFRAELNRLGYIAGLKEAKFFCDAFRESRKPCIVWRLTGNERDGFREIAPVCDKYPAQNGGAEKKAAEPKKEQAPSPVRGQGQPKKHSGKKSAVPMNMPIEEMALSVRATNCLKRAGINTVGELVLLNVEELAMVRNLGRKSREEIMEKLRALGLCLRKKK